MASNFSGKILSYRVKDHCGKDSKQRCKNNDIKEWQLYLNKK